ncbi:MAG: ribosome maturation factor RimM [Alphaproteobacteria bacterium]
MNENKTTQWVCIGAIAGAFGVRGEVKIKPFTAELMACASYGPLCDESGTVVLTPTKPRLVKKFVAVSAKEVATREQAEALKSTKLYVSRDLLPAVDEDEFYYTDLIGLSVETVDGDDMGRIKAIHDFGGGDILEIQTLGQKDWYHAFTKLSVPHVDVAGGKVIIEIVAPDETSKLAEEGG